MKNFLPISFFILLVLSSCSDDCCINVPDNHYDVSIVDEEGNDLMDLSAPNYYNPENIRLFIVEGGNEILVKPIGGGNLDSPHGVMPFTIEGKNYVRLFFGYQGKEDEFTGIVQWNESERDTMVHKFNMPGESKHLKQILRNDEVLWDGVNNNSSPSVTIKR